MKKILLVLTTLFLMGINSLQAQEIEKIDKFSTGYVNGTYMNKFKSVDGVLYAVGYEGTRDWILVRYPAGSRSSSYTVHPNCRRIARGAFQGAAYLKEIYLPETVSLIGEDAFAGCTSLEAIYYGDGATSAVRGMAYDGTTADANVEEVARYNLSGRPCTPGEKGVQIIVYSDFTTKTVIEE